MKQYFFMAIAVAGLFAACTNSHDPEIKGEDGEQIIKLKVSSSGDQLTTRAGRELFSEEASQAIDNVKLVIIDSDNKVVSQTTVGKWSEIASPINSTIHGLETTVRLQGSNKVIGEGTYTILAYGYTTGSQYTELADNIGQVEKGDPFEPEQILSYAISENNLGEEIFAGEGKLNVDSDNTAAGSVTLHRQVAGTFGYFKNIPYEEGASKLVLKSSSKTNSQLVLGKFVSEESTNINVVNGDTPTESNVIYTIDLVDWFNDIKAIEGGNTIDGSAENWKNPYQDKADFAVGSVFGGTFLIPFAAVENANTFVLELQNGDGDALRTWNIKLAANDTQAGIYNLTKWNGNQFVSSSVTETTSSYSILRNHLYSVGERGRVKPSTPGEGTDIPQDLNKDQTLTLTVNDNWEAIHKLVIE